MPLLPRRPLITAFAALAVFGIGCIDALTAIAATGMSSDNPATYLAFTATGTEVMRLTATGSVGIGTTSPASTLHVLGFSTFEVLTGKSIAITTPNGVPGIASTNTNRSDIRWNTGDLSLLASTSSATPAVTDGIIIKSGGNVGIGTTSPTAGYMLDVRGNIVSQKNGAPGLAVSALDNTLTSYGLLNVGVNGLNDVWVASHAPARTISRFGLTLGGWTEISTLGGSSNGLVVGTQTADPLVLGTNNAERLRIDSSGNVGIGTTGPTKKFHVYDAGVADWMGFFQNGTSQAYFANGSAYGAAIDAGASAGSGSYGLFVSHGGSFANADLYVRGDGLVGIGTSVPGLNLDIWSAGGLPASSGTAQTGALRMAQATNGTVLDAGINSASPYGGWLQSTHRTNLSNTYPLLLNPNGGKVGIGTTNPGAPLHVFSSSGNGYARFESPTDYDSGIVLMENNLDKWQILNDGNDSDKLKIGTSDIAANVKLTIQSDGLVGIGTATPQATLDVNGYARLKLNSSAPVACSASYQGSIALTQTGKYLCACNTSNTWTIIGGSTACTWTN